jgi:hypothetical protein
MPACLPSSDLHEVSAAPRTDVMPYKVTFDDQLSCARIKAEGVVTGEEAIELLTALFADDRFPSLRYVISDRTDCLRFGIDMPTTRRIVDMSVAASQINPRLVWALVNPKDYGYAISRVFESMTDGYINAMAFRTMSEAEEWVAEELGKEAEEVHYTSDCQLHPQAHV